MSREKWGWGMQTVSRTQVRRGWSTRDRASASGSGCSRPVFTHLPAGIPGTTAEACEGRGWTRV